MSAIPRILRLEMAADQGMFGVVLPISGRGVVTMEAWPTC
jgi:hypothetical protein